MIVGFTGTRETLTSDERRLLAGIVARLPEDTMVLQGGCRGVDETAARMATGRGLRVWTVLSTTMIPPAWVATHGGHVTAVDGPFRARNRFIAEHCERMIALPLYAEDDARARRSGTWQTVRFARKLGRPVEVHVLRGELTWRIR